MKEEKKILFPKTRNFGKRTTQDDGLLKQLYSADKYVIFHPFDKKPVHIVPSDKLQAMLNNEKETVVARVVEILEGMKRGRAFSGQITNNEYYEALDTAITKITSEEV